ncbi:alpha-(1,3)-fucosyltransferase C [Drosophila ficusphila]|uniref:alpha-(1,3)-fucosyltransferase C n=1 Tax=Drosophila ficusphila TaxID=30025 RepID=UPI0007E82240|nr:alpha-(1,3)-fucosyltransferase C [Drosophila ficusphila]
MPIDKLRAMPVDKILSFRRNPDPQQQQRQQTDEMEEIPRFLPAQLLNDDEKAKDADRRMLDSDSISTEDADRLPPPRRSPVSMMNLQRELYSPNQCLSALKSIAAVITICMVFAIIPLYRRQKMEKDAGLKMILLWNDHPLAGQSAHMECGCLVTNRRNHNDKPFDAVVFNADFPYSFEGLNSTKRSPDFYLVYAAKKPLSSLSGLRDPPFNLTMTYRTDSQLIWTDYYFSYSNLARRLKSFRTPSKNFADDMSSAMIQSFENKMKKKTRLAVYLIYEVNQNTLAQSLYLEELRKYADFDAHGSCLGSHDCSYYHFMLIFEPTACPDYLPPEMYMAMDKLLVPVLIGGGNLTNLVPHHSFISSRDFSTPRELVAHLKDLANDPEEYRRYFWWHSLYKLRQSAQPYCALCSLIQQNPEERQIGQGSSKLAFIDWWTEYHCPNRSTTFL